MSYYKKHDGLISTYRKALCRNFLSILIVLPLSVLSCVSQKSIGIVTNDEFTNKIAKIDSWLNFVIQKENFNGSVLIGLDGKIVLKKYNGIANKKTKHTIDSSSSYYIASVSKHITAICIGILIDRKELSLSDDVDKFLRNFPYKNIAIDDLLHHTSGLPSDTDFVKTSFSENEIKSFLSANGVVNRMMTNQDVINILTNLQPPVHFSPGTNWEYNNINYYLLASIIEEVTGYKFPIFVEKEISLSLKLRNTAVFYENIGSDIIKDRVLGYQGDTLYDLTVKNGAYGAGNIYTSCEDLFAINEALFNGNLLSNEMKKLFITPVKLRNGNFPKIIDGADSYGFGMFLNTTPQGVIAWHSGIWRGFRAYIGRKIDHNILMVVFDNTIGNDNNAHYVELNSAFEKL